jgi:hypothetical protein
MSPIIAVKVSVSLREDGCHVEGETCRTGIHSTWERGVNNVMGYIGGTSLRPCLSVVQHPSFIPARPNMSGLGAISSTAEYMKFVAVSGNTEIG